MAKSNARKVAAGEGDNCRIWNKLCVTPAEYGKQFTRAGGFKGTSIDPVWRIRMLTELFGPVGKGWGFIQEDQWSDGGAGVYTVYVRGHIWYVDEDGERCETMSHTGGTVVESRENGYGKTVSNADEVYKMAETDAFGKCCLDLGLSADIYMGIHDTDKYQQPDGQQATAGRDAGKRPAGNDPKGYNVPKDEKRGKAATPIASSEVEGCLSAIAELKDDVAAYDYSRKLFNRMLGSKDLKPKDLALLAERMASKRCEFVDESMLDNLKKTLTAYQKQGWMPEATAKKMLSLCERRLGIPPEPKE